jgi:uracil-DNA glycosylase family 4
MKPTGVLRPEVYMLGEAPGQDEVEEQEQFVGKSGKILRPLIPKRWKGVLRWNNCVRTRPPNNRTPTPMEIDSCRHSVENDIVKSAPRAVFGFGNVPLEWMTSRTGITVWTGRYLPVKVLSHTCWFFPMMHPAYIARTFDKRPPEHLPGFRSDLQFTFNRHLKHAFKLVEDLPDPVVHTVDDAFHDVDFDMRCNDNSIERIRSFVLSMYDAKTVGVDLETNALRPYSNASKILTIALSGSRGTLAWPMYHKQARWTKEQLAQLEIIVEDFIRKAPCKKVVHNLTFEQEWFAVLYGVDSLRETGNWGCSMGQAFILDNRIQSQAGGGPLSLAFLTLQHFGLDIKKLAGIDRKDLDNVDLDHVLRYNAVDARYHRLLFLRQAKLLDFEDLTYVYDEHIRRVTTTCLTQVKGVPVDLTANKKLTAKYEGQRQKVWEELNALPVVKDFRETKGRSFKPVGPGDVRWCVQQLPKDISKAARDNKGELSSMSEKQLGLVRHPVASLTLKYRKLNKVISTYIEPVREHVFDDGKAHPQTSVCRTRTWRTSASDWNYQNQIKRDQARREIRSQVAKKGCKVVSFDYAQIQARNIGMESLDKNLLKAFKDRYDIHSDWVERIVRVHPRWVKEGAKKLATDKVLFKKYRDKVKQDFVFSSFFGARGHTVAYYLGCDDRIGEELHDQLWDMFPGVQKWHKRLETMYFDFGYVTGHSGFRRHGPISYNEMINAPIQADESMIVLDAMTRLSELDWVYQTNMEIHDDLTFIWPHQKVDERIETVLDTMLTVPYPWARVCPIGVEVLIGDDWYQQKPAGEYFSDTWRKK